MNVWYFPIPWLQMVKCEVCGRAFEPRSDYGPAGRTCRSCLNAAPEKRAA